MTRDAYCVQLGKRLRRLRNDRDMSQHAVGRKLGIRRECISNYERGQRLIDVFTLTQFASLFSVSIDYLITGKPQPCYQHPTYDDSVREDTETIRYCIETEADGSLVVAGDVALVKPTMDYSNGQLMLISIKNKLQLARLTVTGSTIIVRRVANGGSMHIVDKSEVEIKGIVTAIIPHQE